jgi:hypothetical protein
VPCPRAWATSLSILMGCLAQAQISEQASAATSSSMRADFQDCNELDLSAKLAERIDMTWVSKERIGDDLRNPSTHYSTGIDVNVAASNHLTLTPPTTMSTIRLREDAGLASRRGRAPLRRYTAQDQRFAARAHQQVFARCTRKHGRVRRTSRGATCRSGVIARRPTVAQQPSV